MLQRVRNCLDRTDEVRIGRGCRVFQDTRLKEQVAAQQTQHYTFPPTFVATFSTGNNLAGVSHRQGTHTKEEGADDLDQDFCVTWQNIWKRDKKTTMLTGRCSY